MPFEKLSQKLSLETLTKKQFVFLRSSIYLLGFFVALGFISFQILQIKAETFEGLLLKQQQGNSTTLQQFSTKDYSHATLSLELSNDVFERIDENKIDVRVVKTLSPLLREQGNIIAEEKELSKRLFKKNKSSIPNGSLISNNFSTFYIEQGGLRKLDGADVMKFFKTDSNKTIRIKKEDLEEMQPQEPLSAKHLMQDLTFPKDLLIESSGKFYITGANTLHPIFSKKLIEKIWPELSFISVKSPKKANLPKMNCSKDESSKELICKAVLELLENQKMNLYHFVISDLSSEEITGSKLDLETDTTFSTYKRLLKELLW